MKVLVGSKNPVKIEATKEAFKKYFGNVEVVGIEVNSKVSKQPIGMETFVGAKNRVEELKKFEADFYVGIEGGIMNMFERWFAFAVVCISDKHGKCGYGVSSFFELPQIVINEIKNGKELGEVMDELTRRENTKQKEGAIGILTKGIIDRKSLYVPAIVCALIPFLNRDLFQY
jgi:inosine/xanthosine triphosphatase